MWRWQSETHLLPRVDLAQGILRAEIKARSFPMIRNWRTAACSVAALLAIGSCPAVASAGVVNPGFYELAASSEEGQRYEQARMLALALLGGGSELD